MLRLSLRQAQAERPKAADSINKNLAMKQLIKKLVPQSVLDARERAMHQKMYDEWKANGEADPVPHLIKQQTIAEYAKKHSTATLVETGTYLGHMVCAMLDKFQRIISIELAQHFHEQAKERFKKDKHVELLQGDSGNVLTTLAPTIDTPALFWLDGHYSSGETAKGDLNTPIMKELDAVLGGNINHVVLIDDARCFNGTEDYPTMEGLEAKIKSLRSDYTIEVAHDIIRVCPPLPNA